MCKLELTFVLYVLLCAIEDDEYLDADVPEESNTIKLRFKNATFIEPTGTSCVNKRKQEGA